MNEEVDWILTYLQTNKLACYPLMDGSRRLLDQRKKTF